MGSCRKLASGRYLRRMQTVRALREALRGWGWAAFGVAAGLHVVAWGMTGLSHDEYSALRRVFLTDSWEAFWSEAVLVDAHPAGVQAFLTGWVWLGDQIGVGLGGAAPLWVKFPFVAGSLSGLVALVLVGRRLVGREAAWLAVAVYGALHWVVLQGAIARPYGVGAAAVLWGAAVLVAPSMRGRVWKLGVAWAVAAYVHHFAALEAGLVWAAGMVWGRPEDRRAVGWSGVVGLVLYAPHVPVLWHQWGHGGLGGFLAPPEPAFVSTYLSLLLNDSAGLWAVLLGLAVGAAIGVRSGRVWRAVGLGVGLFAVPLGLAYAYSVWRAPILMDRTLFFGAPFLVLAVAAAAVAGWQRWTGWRPEWLVGVAGCMALLTLFVNRAHHVTAWQSTYLEVFQAAVEHPEALTVLNGPNLAWEMCEGQTHWRPQTASPATYHTLQPLAGDSTIPSIAIGRAANHQYLTPDADALLWFQRPLLEQRDFYNGDYRRYGALRSLADRAPGLSAPSLARSSREFPVSIEAPLLDVLAATDSALAATPNREIYAGLQIKSPLPDGTELVLKIALDDTVLFYRSVQPDRCGGGWLAVGVRLADLDLSKRACQGLRCSAFLWNPRRMPLTTGPLTLSAVAGNPLQYAWSQRIPRP